MGWLLGLPPQCYTVPRRQLFCMGNGCFKSVLKSFKIFFLIIIVITIAINADILDIQSKQKLSASSPKSA